MELTGTQIRESPLTRGRVRIIGKVSYDDRGDAEDYWFDVPERHAAFLSTSGNPWLAALLPLAVTLGQPLRLALPIDRVLHDNLRDLQQIWSCWYPDLPPVAVQADVTGPVEAGPARKNAAFFSGGVDSWFTVLQHDEARGEPKRIAIDDLLCVWGFDVPIANADAFQRMRIMLQEAADQLGKELVDVSTNLRETRWRQTDWTYLSHGAGLASVALVLERRYANVLIASSGGYADMTPYGSHVATDRLYSTARTAIIHDGAVFSRLRKTELVAQSDLALRSLRVCWRSRGNENCCACEKCYRTMLALELLGALHRSSTFQRAGVDLASVARIYAAPELRAHEYRDLLLYATKQRRADIAGALQRSMRASPRLDVWLKWVETLKRTPRLRRLGSGLERVVLFRRLN